MSSDLARVPWPPIVAVSGRSGSGKTLLIEQLVPRLGARGLRVGVMKDCHHALAADTPGKDSDRVFQAGADVLAWGPGEALARLRPDARSRGQWVRRLFSGHDVVLAEGFREQPLPRLSVRGEADEHTFLRLEDPVAQAEAAADAVWELLQRTHQERPVARLILARDELAALFSEDRHEAPCRAAWQTLRGCPGARLTVAEVEDNGACAAPAQLLTHGGPGVDMVYAAGPGAPLALLEPSAQAVLEQAAQGDREAWVAALAGPRSRRVDLQVGPEASP